MTLNFLTSYQLSLSFGMVLLVTPTSAHKDMRTDLQKDARQVLPVWFHSFPHDTVCGLAGDKDTSLSHINYYWGIAAYGESVASVFADPAQPQTASYFKEAACLWLPITLQTELKGLKCQPQDPHHPGG